MIDETSELVERLRRDLRDWDGKSRFHFPSVNARLIDQAAALIERQSQDVERLVEALERARRSFEGIKREAVEGSEYGRKHGAVMWDSSLGVIASSAERNAKRARQALTTHQEQRHG